MGELEEEKRKFEEEQARIVAEEQARKEKLERRKLNKAAQKEQLKEQGLYLTKSEKEKKAAADRYKAQLQSMGVVAEEEEKEVTKVTITPELKEFFVGALIKQQNKWVINQEPPADLGIEKWSILDKPITFDPASIEENEELGFMAPKK